MNILVINYRDLEHPLAGGAEVHLHRIFGEIAKKEEHEVHLLTTAFDGCDFETEVDGIKIHRMGSDGNFNIVAFLRLHGFIKRYNIDVVVEDLNKIPIYIPLITRKPMLIQMHHLWGKSIFKEASFFKAFMVWAMEKSIKFFYKNKKFVSVSPSTKDEIVKLGIPSCNVSVIYNGLEEGFTKPKNKSENSKPYFLWLGRLRKYKGVMIALEAFKEFTETYPGYELKIAGDGPFRSEIEKWITNYSMDARVKLYGFVDESEKLSLLQGAEVLIQSSIKEGWGLTVIEANACGVPAVASNVPGLKDSIIDGETGMLFDVSNSSQLSDCLLKLAEDKEFHKTLSNNAIKHANTFSWKQSAEHTLDLLNEVVSLNSKI